MEENFTIGLIVANHFGVLNRISGLFSKRGYNIDSLAVGETDNPKYSRITIVSKGDEYVKDQVVKQLMKLHDVSKVILFDENAVSVEHSLVKLSANNINKVSISNLINDFGGKVMDFDTDFITAEITGSRKKIDEFILKSKEFGILEVCRSGVISMERSVECALSTTKI